MLEGGAPESSRTKNKRQGCCGADPGAQQEVEFPANGVGEGSPTSKPLFSRWCPPGLPSVRQNLRATLMCLLLMAEHTEHLLSMSRHLDSFEKLPIILLDR